MRRREFIAGSAAAALLPIAIRAQRAERVRRVDVLFAEAMEDDPYYERLGGSHLQLSNGRT